ncbi:DHA2 family efflux MFS transporter permease subunit [Paenibacillus bovis]|uniref:MFS transporter n=1 Tax=Paenibacillus bovis TaxID=1616788 RepID=A0A172ZHX7_9BACL|nr:DHA2 family efflux MFS transporter permease subunit [Paenibacillus bovis]ANF97143.1 MFS transporter [Paenibacillus bovis]
MSTSSPQSFGLPKKTLGAAWAIALGAIAPMLDSTMINIAIDPLNQAFHTTLAIVQWAITGYILALAVAVPISGWLMNRYNGKRIFIGAVIAFGLLSILTGISWNISIFVFFRLLQGFSAGIITALMSALLVKTAGPDHLGKVIAIVSTPMILGPILGPVIGGMIIQIASWHWIFFINVFILCIAVPLMIKYIPDFEPFDKNSRLDMPGIILLSTISAVLIYGITQASGYASFHNRETLLWVGIGLVLIAVYMAYDHMRGHQTVLPMNLFAHRSFAASSAGLFLANMAIIGPMLILPLFFQSFRHFTAIESALALIPQGVGMLITRPLIGTMIDRIGAKYVVIVSLGLALIGSVPLVFITDQTSMIWIAFLLFIRGTSVGGIMLPLTSDAYTGLDSRQIPEASIGINIIENLGSSFGSAVMATVVASSISPIQSAMDHPEGYQAGFLVSAIVLALIFFPGLLLTHKKNIHHRNNVQE